MEEKIYQLVVEKLGKTSLSERTIKSKAARASKKIESEDAITDDFITDIVDDLKDLDGNYNHDLATAKAELEKRYPKPSVKPTEPRVEPSPKEDEYSKKISELEEWKAKLEREFAEKAQIQKEESYRRDVKNTLKDSCKNEAILRLATHEVGIDTNKSVEDVAKAIRERYDKEIAAGVQAGIFPQESLNASITPLTETEIAERAKEEKKLLTNF